MAQPMWGQHGSPNTVSLSQLVHSVLTLASSTVTKSGILTKPCRLKWLSRQAKLYHCVSSDNRHLSLSAALAWLSTPLSASSITRTTASATRSSTTGCCWRFYGLEEKVCIYQRQGCSLPEVSRNFYFMTICISVRIWDNQAGSQWRTNLFTKRSVWVRRVWETICLRNPSSRSAFSLDFCPRRMKLQTTLSYWRYQEYNLCDNITTIKYGSDSQFSSPMSTCAWEDLANMAGESRGLATLADWHAPPTREANEHTFPKAWRSACGCSE